jgi:hypothetical protein
LIISRIGPWSAAPLAIVSSAMVVLVLAAANSGEMVTSSVSVVDRDDRLHETAATTSATPSAT